MHTQHSDNVTDAAAEPSHFLRWVNTSASSWFSQQIFGDWSSQFPQERLRKAWVFPSCANRPDYNLGMHQEIISSFISKIFMQASSGPWAGKTDIGGFTLVQGRAQHAAGYCTSSVTKCKQQEGIPWHLPCSHSWWLNGSSLTIHFHSPLLPFSKVLDDRGIAKAFAVSNLKRYAGKAACTVKDKCDYFTWKVGKVHMTIF